MTLQLLHSEFPYIWGKFYFLFYHCAYQKQGKMRLRDTTNIIKPTYLAISRKKCFYFKIKPEKPLKLSKNQPRPLFMPRSVNFFQNIWNLFGDPIPFTNLVKANVGKNLVWFIHIILHNVLLVCGLSIVFISVFFKIICESVPLQPSLYNLLQED